MSIFASKGFSAKGNVLPHDKFRLFTDIPELVPVPEKMERVIKNAEAALVDEIPRLPLSLYREFQVNGNRSRFEDAFFKRRWMALWLALAEGHEKQGRFTEKLADVIWEILEESTWVIPAHMYLQPCQRNDGVPPVIGEETMHGVDLSAGATTACLTIVYMYAKDVLDSISETICLKIEHMINERIIKPYLQCAFWWIGDIGWHLNNWSPWVTSNILLTTGVFVKDMSTRERIVDKAMATIDKFTKFYASDGGCDEGPSYWGSAAGALFNCLELIEDLTDGKITVYDDPLVRNMGDYIYKVNIDGTQYVNFADSPPSCIHSPSKIIRYGKKCNSPFLQAFGHKLAAEDDFDVTYWHGYSGLKNLYVDLPEATNCDMPTFSYLENLVVMTARDSADSSNCTFLGAKGGHNGESHSHNDVGNFVVYRNAKPVIIDVGVGVYTKQTFSDDRYELWFMQSGYHNCPSFAGIDQLNGRKYFSEVLEISEEKKLLKIDATAAYPPESGLESYTRSVCLDGSAVRLNDTFAYQEGKGGETDFHLMCCVEPVITAPGKIALAEGMTLSYDTALEASVETFDPVGLNAKGAWKTDMLYRIHFKTNATKGSFDFVVE